MTSPPLVRKRQCNDRVGTVANNQAEQSILIKILFRSKSLLQMIHELHLSAVVYIDNNWQVNNCIFANTSN